MPEYSLGTPPPPYDQPLHNRFAEASVPEAAALTDLTSGRMLLLRGGPGVSASGGGYGGTLSAERYFLVGLEEGYHLNVAEGVGEVSLKAKVIEVYLDGNHLCIDPIRSVQSTTSSTTIRLPVSIEGLRQEQIALVNSEHAIVWKDEFTRIWGDASAMKAGRDADTLAYMKLTRRIEHLPDALAAQAGKILETNPLRNPERLAEVLEGQEPLKRIDLMNLEAMRGRQIIRKAINKALVPGANRTELTLKETKAAGRAISDVFGLNFLGETGRGVQNNPEEIIRGVFNKLGELKALNLPKGEYAITSSGALAARGIRSAENIDIITSQHLWEQLAEKHPVVVDGDIQRIRIGKHIEILGPGSSYRNKDIVPVRTQLRQATTIQGFPFASLEHVAAVKRSTAGSKDLQDLDLIQAYQAHSSAQVGHGIRTVSDRSLDGPRETAIHPPVPGVADVVYPIYPNRRDLVEFFKADSPPEEETIFEVVFRPKEYEHKERAQRDPLTGRFKRQDRFAGIEVRGGTLHLQPFSGETLGTYTFQIEHEALFEDAALIRKSSTRTRYLMHGDYVRDWLKANEVNEKHKPYKPGQRTTHLGDTGDPYTMLDLGTFALGESKQDALRAELHMPLYEARATEGENELNAGIRQESLELKSETAQKRGEAMAFRATKKRERDLKQGNGKRVVTPQLDPEISAVFQGSARVHQLTEEYNSLTSQLSSLQASAPGVVSVKVQDLTERLEEVQRELHGVRSVSSLSTVKVGGREVRISGLRDAGTFDNQGSYAAQNPDRLTVLGRPQDLVRGQDPTHAYIAEQVTSGEAINQLVNPKKKIKDLEGKWIKPEDFFKKYATITDEGIKWDSRLYKPTLEAPKLSERIPLPARAVPGARGVGVISVDRSFFTSLFEVPAPHRLSKEEALLRTTDESLRKRIQEEGVSELQQMNYAMSQGLLMVPKGHALYDLQSAMAKIPELHRLMLRGGKDTIGEDGTLIKRVGAYERGSFERYILSLIHTPNRKERTEKVDYQAGLRNVLRLNREVSQKYLGGAVVDPIQLLGEARLLAPTATAELRTLTDGLDLDETPLLSEALSFSQSSLEKIGSGARNAPDIGRKMVEHFVSKKGWRVRAPHEGGSLGTRQVGEAEQAASDAALREEIERNKTQSLHIVNTDDDKEFTFTDIGEGTSVGNAVQTTVDPEAQALENLMQEAAEKAASVPREPGIRDFMSVRDFFGQLSRYQGQDPKERHSSVNRALETLENPDEDYRRGSFFGFSFDPKKKDLSSVRALTAEQYARRTETNRIAPTRMHFEFVQGLNPHEQKALASRVGYQPQDTEDLRKNKAHWLPIDNSISAPAGYNKFLEQGVEQGWLTEKEAEETRLSEAQFHILQQIFQTPIMDTLLLDRNPEADLPSWHKRVDRFLKKPEKGFPDPLSVADRRRFVPEDPHNEGDMTDSLSQPLVEDGLDKVLGGEKIQKERLTKMTEIMQGEKAWEFAGTPGIERDRIIESAKEAPLRVGITDSEEGERYNDVFYPHTSTPVIATAESLAKGYKEQSWSSAWQRPMSDERVPLRQIASGDNRAFISPERTGTSEHETLQRFLDSMENGAHVVGFDIESDPLDFVKDKDGNFALDKKGKRIATKDSRYQLTNVGSQGFLIGPGGEKIKEETAFDMASESFIKRKGLQNAVPPTSAFGVTDEEHMVSSAYEHLSSYNKDTFFAVFNTAYDAPRMAGYAQKAIDSHTSLLESALSKEEEDNARLRVEHFQAAKDFFDVEMPSRMFDAEHVLQLAGARPGKSQLVDYLRGAGVLGPYEEQIHGSSRDVGDMMQGVFTALKAFLQGPAKVQDLDKQYFFPLQVTDREQAIGEDGNIKRKRLKSPFLMEGVTQTDGEHGPVFTLYGRSIDKDGTPIGPLEPKIVRTGAGQFQRTLSQDFGDGQTFLTADKEGLAEAWKKSLDPENLRDLVERDVRRAQIFNDKSSPNEALREEFKARADIVQKYEALDSEVDKQNYITTVVKNLTEQSYRTIDTKDAQDIYPFLNAKSAGRIHDWLNSGTRDNAGNEGFAIPHTREVDRQVGRIIKERETSGRDMLFDQLLYPAVLDGTLSPEESQKTSQAFQSLADTLYMTGQRETGRKEGLVISLKSLRNGRASLTSLSGQPTLTEIQAMSPEEREGRGISSDLYKEILRKPKRISDVPGMNQEDVYNALFTHGLAVSYKAQKMIADTEEKEMSPSFHQNLDSQIITDLMRDLRSSAPELEELGILQTHQSLHSLAEDIRQTLATSTRQRTVPDDMETGPRRDESGNPATWGSSKEKFQPFTSTTLPEEDKIEDWLVNPENPRQLAFDLINKSRDNSGKYTTPALARTLPSITPQGVTPEVADALRETLRGRNEPSIPNTESVRLARDPNAEAHSEDVASGAARLVRDVLSEQAEHAVHGAEESLGETFAQEGLKGVANSRIGLGIGALLGLAALSDIGSRVMDSEDKRDGLLPGSGSGDTSHNAGKLDTEINQSGNDANTQAAEGWKKLHVNIDITHNGFPGSSARLSSEALNAFSQDVGKVLTSHFNSTPQYSQSESKSQNNEPLRFRIGNALNRASGRYGSN